MSLWGKGSGRRSFCPPREKENHPYLFEKRVGQDTIKGEEGLYSIGNLMSKEAAIRRRSRGRIKME